MWVDEEVGSQENGGRSDAPEEKKRRRLQDAAAGGRGGDLGVSPAAPSSSAMMEVTDFPEGTQQRVPCLGASMSQTAVNQHLGK